MPLVGIVANKLLSLDKYVANSQNTLNDKITKILNTNISSTLSVSSLLSSATMNIQPYLQYLQSFKNYVKDRNISGQINQNIFDKIWTPFSESLFINNVNNGVGCEYVMNIINNFNFNPSIITKDRNSISLPNVNDEASIQIIESQLAPKISECWVIYNEFSEIVSIGQGGQYNNAMFDELELMRENIMRQHPVTISNEFVYIMVEDGNYMLVSSQVNWVYNINIEGVDMYFRTYDDMVKYCHEYVSENSERIN